MKCPDCDVGWSEYALEGTGRVCWHCGKEIPVPATKPKPAVMFTMGPTHVRPLDRG